MMKTMKNFPSLHGHFGFGRHFFLRTGLLNIRNFNFCVFHNVSYNFESYVQSIRIDFVVLVFQLLFSSVDGGHLGFGRHIG